MRKIIVFLLAFVCLALPVAAAEPFIALVDHERGVLLIPEGSAVPKGVEFYLGSSTAQRDALSIDGAETPEAPMQRLVYAYAAAHRFVEARQRIEKAEAESIALKSDDLGPLSISDSDQMFYYYFNDGSWHGVRKVIKNVYPGAVQYGIQTYANAAGGDQDSKITVKQSGNPFGTPWSMQNTCLAYGPYGGGCNTPTYAAQAGPTWTGSFTSYVTITHYFYPPCDLPCKQNLSSTVVVNYP